MESLNLSTMMISLLILSPALINLYHKSIPMLIHIVISIGFLVAYGTHASKGWNFFVPTPILEIILVILILAPLKYMQVKLRYLRLSNVKFTFQYTNDPASWEHMTVEDAQYIERNLAEWEFPRLWQFGWISDFLRTSTDPGVSRAIAHSGHFLSSDPLVAHRRQQDTIHLMTAMAAYSVKSHYHSLVIARINEHHHRYGTKINSDDVLYLIIHFAFAPVPWIETFGYRKLEAFEIHAIWVLWREIACRMGVKYIPYSVAQANEWRKVFEESCRWPTTANQAMAVGLLDQIIYPIPTLLHPFARKLVASIVDRDIVYFNQLEHLGPSPLLRSIVFDIFRACGWFIREFGLPRAALYRRSPDRPNRYGLMNFDYTPYETTPFYIDPSFWNLYGFGALLRRLRGIPLPNPKYFGNGIAFESMGAPHGNQATQEAVETKVRSSAAILEKAGYGFRPNVGFQGCRLIGPVDGPTYGLDMNTFPAGTILAPPNEARFEKEYQRRGPGFSKLQEIVKPEDVTAHSSEELATPNGSRQTPPTVDSGRVLMQRKLDTVCARINNHV